MTQFKFTQRGWKGFDFDGCISSYDGWVGFGKTGAPVEAMVDRLVKYAQEGWEVRIVTARVHPDPDSHDISVEDRIKVIRAWIEEYIRPRLPEGYPEIKIVSSKDKNMHEMFDDRIKQVFTNTGIVVEDALRALVVDSTKLVTGNMTDNEKVDLMKQLRFLAGLLDKPFQLPENK